MVREGQGCGRLRAGEMRWWACDNAWRQLQLKLAMTMMMMMKTEAAAAAMPLAAAIVAPLLLVACPQPWQPPATCCWQPPATRQQQAA